MSLRIVYLDDEPMLCEIFVDLFSSIDIEIKTFTDSDLARQFITDHSPDLIFIDYRLPGTNGDEVAQLLPSEIPKFLITGEAAVDTKYRFKRIFKKPYEEQLILSSIHEYLQQS